MKVLKCIITDESGIHARPAGRLAALAKGFTKTKIFIEREEKRADAERLFMLMALGVRCGDSVSFIIEGAYEDAALTALSEFLSGELSYEIL